jgi:hypothetical protein
MQNDDRSTSMSFFHHQPHANRHEALTRQAKLQ